MTDKRRYRTLEDSCASVILKGEVVTVLSRKKEEVEDEDGNLTGVKIWMCEVTNGYGSDIMCLDELEQVFFDEEIAVKQVNSFCGGVTVTVKIDMADYERLEDAYGSDAYEASGFNLNDAIRNLKKRLVIFGINAKTVNVISTSDKQYFRGI